MLSRLLLLPLLPRADGCCVSIRHRSQALGPRLPSPKNKSGLLPEFHFSPYQCARGVCVGAVSAICMLSGSPGTALGACKFSVKCDIVITKRHFFLGGRFQRGLILDSPHDFATALGRSTLHARTAASLLPEPLSAGSPPTPDSGLSEALGIRSW